MITHNLSLLVVVVVVVVVVLSTMRHYVTRVFRLPYKKLTKNPLYLMEFFLWKHFVQKTPFFKQQKKSCVKFASEGKLIVIVSSIQHLMYLLSTIKRYPGKTPRHPKTRKLFKDLQKTFGCYELRILEDSHCKNNVNL